MSNSTLGGGLAILPHSVGGFRAAAEARYRDGVTLADNGRRLGAVYLFGYAAEMLLKAAYFRLDGKTETEVIGWPELEAAKKHAESVLGLEWKGGLHTLPKWAELLVQARLRAGRPYPADFGRELANRVDAVYANWREFLRYYDLSPSEAELAGVRSAVEWLRDRYPDL